MSYYLITLISILFCSPVWAQQIDTWYACYNQDSTLIGYSDAVGKVMIEPKFGAYTTANRFDAIIAVAEMGHTPLSTYYLTKSGRVIGRDSLHLFDNGPDCESEGFIRFRDPVTGLTGLFDRHGNIVIPAEYSELKRVHNGMIVALKGAKKNRNGEITTWTGGQELLLDTANNILIENFSYNPQLNFFSLQKSTTPPLDSTRASFKGTDGSYYSFVDFKKEFDHWLRTTLLPDLTKEKLNQLTYPQVTWQAVEDWVTSDRSTFIEANFELVKSRLEKITQGEFQGFISSDGLNPFMFNTPDFDDYYNNCGESKDWQYPTMSLIINQDSAAGITQDHLEFLRTAQGYRLLCVTIRSAQLK
ncbi:WG repeat-containing protein [Sphingobacterium sp. SG20118]|uniref:WG repeat-containing protein n=1 Tax=Sphingobacterium sp. SG20118 TaxID=3367156 RepID=UPI0037DFC153